MDEPPVQEIVRKIVGAFTVTRSSSLSPIVSPPLNTGVDVNVCTALQVTVLSSLGINAKSVALADWSCMYSSGEVELSP